MKTCFSSVIYASAYMYKNDFITSLRKQSDQDFEILLLNDDLDEADTYLFQQECADLRIKIINAPREMTLPQLRIYLLEVVKSAGYDLLILGDFDDKFSENRIACIKKSYREEICIYYNQLFTFDGQPVFAELPNEICSHQFILQSNFLGLSNTAINMNLITMEFIQSMYDCQSKVFDWYLYSRILLNKHKGIYVKNCMTFYRIHEANTAGLASCDSEHILKELRVKRVHYQSLCPYNNIYEKLFHKYTKLDTEQTFRNCINKKHQGFWWELLYI